VNKVVESIILALQLLSLRWETQKIGLRSDKCKIDQKDALL
jgi:hypothetical protein